MCESKHRGAQGSNRASWLPEAMQAFPVLHCLSFRTFARILPETFGSGMVSSLPCIHALQRLLVSLLPVCAAEGAHANASKRRHTCQAVPARLMMHYRIFNHVLDGLQGRKAKGKSVRQRAHLCSNVAAVRERLMHTTPRAARRLHRRKLHASPGTRVPPPRRPAPSGTAMHGESVLRGCYVMSCWTTSSAPIQPPVHCAGCRGRPAHSGPTHLEGLCVRRHELELRGGKRGHGLDHGLRVHRGQRSQGPRRANPHAPPDPCHLL